ncbi:uncharacterized protein LOC105282454 [Ooceraea biroi]|uniref:uncharacterized protein LOC105282454 n=1 Tax=Ooceraea biroi TaxID=2015173 RepID=UPI0005BCD139|nr:uncharacterized protein LOC105282454 [Ooceraea biroi]
MRDQYDINKFVLDVVKSFEGTCFGASDDIVNETRIRISSSVHKFLMQRPRLNSIERYICRAGSLCRQFLKNSDDLLVTRADKGQVIVIMDRDRYMTQMKEMLGDEATYLKLNKDPTKRVANKINDLIKAWRNLGIIDEWTYKGLLNTSSNIPRCYGLPKVHKSGVPLRLIVSAVGGPTYNVASFLQRILSNSISKPKSYVRDSWSFVREVAGLTIELNESMVSFDVVSHFTNVPKELVMQAIERRWDQIMPTTKFTLVQFLHAIDIVLCSTSFVFDGQYYDQICGSPMGFPLSPILADIVLDDLETSCIQNLDFNVKIYRRYVDDVFTILPTDRVHDVLEIFNTYHPRLQFTVEVECGFSLNFLDTTIIRDNGNLITNWLDRFIRLGKDILSNYLKTNVVYRIDCEDCEVCYVGQTKRHLSVRVNEHKLNIKKRDDDLSVGSRHRIINDHNFDWSNVKILHQETHVRKREIAEMIFIRKQNNSINLQKDTECLPN